MIGGGGGWGDGPGAVALVPEQHTKYGSLTQIDHQMRQLIDAKGLLPWCVHHTGHVFTHSLNYCLKLTNRQNKPKKGQEKSQLLHVNYGAFFSIFIQ